MSDKLSRRTFTGSALTMLIVRRSYASGPLATTSRSDLGVLRPLLVTEKLEHSTLLINTFDEKGLAWAGTGFVFALFNTKDFHVPVLVTNKHIFSNMKIGSFRVSAKDKSGLPSLEKFYDITIKDFEKSWIGHPDPNVDLGILFLIPALRNAGIDPSQVYWSAIPTSSVPEPDKLRDMDPATDVLVVGYPHGLSDTAHNLPIFRRGITASTPGIDFQGQRFFLIDCAIWPGSSGSPVFSYYNGLIPDRNQNYLVGTQTRLIGIVFRVAEQDLNGHVIVKNIPDSIENQVISSSPNGLGLCASSQALLDFEPLLVSMGFKPPDDFVHREGVR